jgi:S1-C subfamily serine protease
MKIKHALVVLFAIVIGGCALLTSGESWRQSISERNEMTRFIREKIIRPSIFPMKVTLSVSFKDPAKQIPLSSVENSCGLFGSGGTFVVNEKLDLLTVKHNLHNKAKACEKAIELEIKTKKLPLSLDDLSIVSSYFIITPNNEDRVIEVVKESQNKDLALMRIRDTRDLVLRQLPLSNKTSVMGEEIVIVGTPIGIKNAASYGYIARDTLAEEKILFGAAAYPGNSGGPLIDLEKTSAFGIVTDAMSAGNGQLLDYGVAIPAWEIKDFLKTVYSE